MQYRANKGVETANSNHTYCNEISDSEGATVPKTTLNKAKKPVNTIKNLSNDQEESKSQDGSSRDDSVASKVTQEVKPAPSKNMINLENILLIEQKLVKISENLLCTSTICELCEGWWELSQEETMLRNLGNVFKEPRFKQILRAASILEVIGVTLCHTVALQINGTVNDDIMIGKLYIKLNGNNV